MAENGRNVLQELRDQVRDFVQERDWDKFHTPKNLATSLCVEAAELLEPFQWLESGDSSELTSLRQDQIKHEMADVLIYLIRLADKLNVDLVDVTLDKLEHNRKKYPASQVRGDARKYNEY